MTGNSLGSNSSGGTGQSVGGLAGSGCVTIQEVETFSAAKLNLVAGQTVFTLLHDPSGDVTFVRTGASTVDEAAISPAGKDVIYDPAANGGNPILVTDTVTISYLWEDCTASPATDPDKFDLTTPLADLSMLTDAKRGLSAGEVSIPTNRALTIAEMTQAWADKVSLALRYMVSLFTNRAAEPGTAPGVMNPDGSLGWYSPTIGIGAAGNLYNGGSAIVPFNGTTVAILDGLYDGQMRILNSGGANKEAILTGKFRGIWRNSQHVIAWGTLFTSVIMRLTESYLVRWNGSSWVNVSMPAYRFYRSDWEEGNNGTLTISMAGVAGVNFFPAGLLLTNTNYIAATNGPSIVSAKTISGFTLSIAADVTITGAVMDYAAFGGVASF